MIYLIYYYTTCITYKKRLVFFIFIHFYTTYTFLYNLYIFILLILTHDTYSSSHHDETDDEKSFLFSKYLLA